MKLINTTPHFPDNKEIKIMIGGCQMTCWSEEDALPQQEITKTTSALFWHF